MTQSTTFAACRSLCARAGLFVLAGLATATPGGSALADDAYVCDGGRLVYARPETLEKLKQSDPCVAGYFKFQTGPADTPTAQAQTPPASAPSRGTGDGERIRPSVGKSASAAGQAPTPAKAPEASVGTDYRNVHVINAPGDGTIYRHER
jgi:hypothetical protein